MGNNTGTLTDRIIARVKNHKIAAILIVLGVGLSAAGALIKSISEAGVAVSTIFRTAPKPKWFAEIARHPLRPGVGMAGLSIGQSEKDVIATLGEPTRNVGQVIGDDREIFLDKRPGAVLHYALVYEYGNSFLGIYTDRDTRQIRSFRLMCRGAGPECKELPSFRGVAIGAASSSLKVLGEPLRRTERHGCDFPPASATWYQFEGLSVSVCSRDSLVEIIDLP